MFLCSGRNLIQHSLKMTRTVSTNRSLSAGFLIFLIILVFCLKSSIGEVKIWIPTTSVTDNRNWARGELPQQCDRLLLQKAVDVTLKIPSRTLGLRTVSMTLPRQGILKLSENSVITFTNSEKCAGYKQSAEFLRNTVKGWLDPDNWSGINNRVGEGWIPHRSRIPCAGDEIAFLDKSNMSDTADTLSHTAMLPSVLLPIGKIVIANQTFSTSDWTDYLQSEKGHEYFKGPADVRFLKWRTDTGCANEKQCFCGRGAYVIRDWSYSNVDSMVLDEAVCLYARPRCEQMEILCRSPVYPDGHCCGVCGAIVNIHDQTDSGIPLATVTKIMRSLVEDSGYKVKFYVGRMSTGDVQIAILSKNGDSTESYQLAHSVSNRLQQEHIGAFSVSLLSSGWSKEYNPASHFFGEFFGPLFFVIFLFGSIYIVLEILPKLKWMQFKKRDPFTFARFRNHLQEAVSEDTLVLEAARPASESFANPLYNPENIKPKSFVDDGLVEDNDASSTTKADTEKLIQLDDIRKIFEPEEASCVSFPATGRNDESDESDESESSFSQLTADVHATE